MDAVLRNFKSIPCPQGDRCTQPGCQWRHSWDDNNNNKSSTGAVTATVPTATTTTTAGPSSSQDESEEGSRKRQRMSVSPPPMKRKKPVVEQAVSAAKVEPMSKAGTKVVQAAPKEAVSSSTSSSTNSSSSNSPSICMTPASGKEASPGLPKLGSKKQVAVRPTESALASGSSESCSSETPGAAATSTTTSTAATPPRRAVSAKVSGGKSSASASASPSASVSASPRKAESLNPRHMKAAAPATHDYRYKVLKALHEQFTRLNNEVKRDPKAVRLVMSEQELIWLALDEEEKIASEKASSIYKNMITGRILRVKRMTVDKWKEERVAERDKKIEARKAAATAAATTTTTASPATMSSATTTMATTTATTNAGKATAPKANNNSSNKNNNNKVPSLGPPKDLETGLTPAQEVQVLRRLRTPITNLAQHGYVPVVPSEADIEKAREVEAWSKGWEVCDRCTTRFQVFPGRREEDGALASGGTCTHHHGKIYYPERAPGAPATRRYRCCNEAVGDSPGCVTAPTHVFKTTDPKRLAAVVPFAETPARGNNKKSANKSTNGKATKVDAGGDVPPRDRAVCFDCEMGYTVRGLELIRLTATRWPDGAMLLDVLVRPVGEVLDLNSRYSGVWPEDFVEAEPWSEPNSPDDPLYLHPDTDPDLNNAAVEDGEIEEDENSKDNTQENIEKEKNGSQKLRIVPSPAAARSLLCRLLAPDTPLIGHGLENDLNAARLVHPTVVDTVLLFPHHRGGLPSRYGLRQLAETRLNRRIQAGDAGRGHDSAEDARAAGDLVRLKVREEWAMLKRLGWRFVEGGDELVPPAVAVGTGHKKGGGSGGVLTEAFLEGDNSKRK